MITKVVDTLSGMTGKLLVAAPSLAATPFDGAVILMCSHDAEGSMGIIVNRPMNNSNFASLMSDIEISTLEDISVYYGGPVETTRGFVVHDHSYLGESSVVIGEQFALTATLDILEHIAAGRGPEKSLFALGYAGWAGGQLDEELKDDSWFVSDATFDVVFNPDDQTKRVDALASLGIHPARLAQPFGNA